MYPIKFENLYYEKVWGGLQLQSFRDNLPTYKVYDYGRDRELHVEKSLDVIDFNLVPERLVEDYKDYSGYKYTDLCKNEIFTIDKCIVNSQFKTYSKEERFSIITCVQGVGTIEVHNCVEEIKKSDSFLIPASLGEYLIKGDLEH